MNTISKILDSVEFTASCWLWGGYSTVAGYGRIYVNSKRVFTQRIFYLLAHSEIPEGLVIDHLCGVKLCVNPDHLEAVTHKENIRRGQHTLFDRAYCRQGHEFTEENTYTWGLNKRQCIQCRRIASRKRYWRTKNSMHV